MLGGMLDTLKVQERGRTWDVLEMSNNVRNSEPKASEMQEIWVVVQRNGAISR